MDSFTYAPLTSMSIPDTTLGYLQEIVLSAALLGERLPGTRRPLSSVCGCWRRHDQPVRVLTSNLARSLRIDHLPGRVRALTPEQLSGEAGERDGGEVCFVSFQPAVCQTNRVQIMLEVGAARYEGWGWRQRELCSIEAEFQDQDGRWVATREPSIFVDAQY